MEEHLVDQLFDTNAVDREVATEKVISYLTDLNGTSYNGQILFDLSPWSNSGRMIDYANSYIEIPFIVDATVAGGVVPDPDTTSPVVVGIPIPENNMGINCNPFCIGLKNGFYQLIDSIQVSVNGRTVVDQQNFTNFHTNFRVMTSWSQDDLKKWGSSFGVYPDDSGSTRFSLAPGLDGEGYCNNIPEVMDFATSDFVVNRDANPSFEKRQELTTAYNPATEGLPTAPTNTNRYGMSTFTRTATNLTWYVVATIRLKDLCPFFESAGLMRGVNVRATINYNSSKTQVIVAGTNAAATSMAFKSQTQTSGNTNPILVTSLRNGANTLTQGNNITGSMNRAGTYTIESKIGSIPALSNCRWYAASYDMTPAIKTRLATSMPIRNIRYNDIYSFKITKVATGAFNTIISNGIVNPKYIVILPYANTDASVYTTLGIQGVPTWQSPFDTAPSTTAPLANIDNFQIQVGGKNLHQTSFEFNYQQFLFEVACINAQNAGAMTGATSGLIDQHDFNFNYRYYVADLSRRLEADNKVPQSIAVLGTNTSGVPMDYLVFIAYEKSITIDSVTGQYV